MRHQTEYHGISGTSGRPARRRRGRALPIGPALLLLAGAAPAAAQGWVEPPPRVAPGEWGVVKLRTNVHVRVTGNVAEVEVEEWFENRGGGLGEGDYVYPLPGEAVFSDFSLWQGDEELRGETMDAERARAIYEQIVRRRKDPALIELFGHGLVRARVFPFQPGETRRIALRYTQVLERSGGALAFRYAAGGRTGGGVITPVPVPRPMPEPLTEGVRPRRSAAEPVPVTFELETRDVERFGEPFSPTHELRVEREAGRLVVRPASRLSGDFALFLPIAQGRVGMTLVTHRPVESEPGYFMLTLSPGADAGDALPRDVTAVVDVSGSMSGGKLRQTQQALRQLLSSLGTRDRFRLIAFNNSVRSYRPDWTPATPERVGAARTWIDGLGAGGGTNIAAALREAFAAPSAEGRLPIVLFLTDGLPTVEERDPERIARVAEQERGQARVFTFGVGFDVNTYLLDRLSTAGRGATEYVGPDEDVESAVARIAAKVSHPVLTDLRIDGAPTDLREVHPRQLPDLFAGEELVVLGRYAGGRSTAEGAVRLVGRRSGGEERFSVTGSFPRHEPGNDFIPRLWASRKVGALMREIRLGGEDPELVEEVRRTALRYGILTEYTSHLVQEPGIMEELAVAPQAFSDGAAAGPPALATGQQAVAASRSAGRRSRAESMEAVAAADDEVEQRVLLRAGLSSERSRLVAGRLFVERDGHWVDARLEEDVRTLRVRPFSEAYFELLRLLPELRPVLSEFSAVTVAGERLGLVFTDDGAERLTGDRSALVRAFRGR